MRTAAMRKKEKEMRLKSDFIGFAHKMKTQRLAG
jgi:hypothetical protein